MRVSVRFTSSMMLLVALSLAAGLLSAQTPPKAHSEEETWYEFLLKQCNPSNFDYGRWLEQRRRALWKVTVNNPQFWYSISMTAAVMLMSAVCAKLMLDNRRRMRITAEMMADLYNHDLYSRQAAREAIERYNQHIEQCNRRMESVESGESRGGSSELERLRAELRSVAMQLEAAVQDRNKLQEELRQKSLIVADLSARIDVLSRKANASKGVDVGAGEAPATNTSEANGRLVGQINRLQEELYAERQKNKRLKGV
jgi:hypothetical protein